MNEEKSKDKIHVRSQAVMFHVVANYAKYDKGHKQARGRGSRSEVFENIQPLKNNSTCDFNNFTVHQKESLTAHQSCKRANYCRLEPSTNPIFSEALSSSQKNES